MLPIKKRDCRTDASLLKRHDTAGAVSFDNELTNWGVEQEVGHQCLPINLGLDDASQAGGDGFYYAILSKN